MEIDPTELPNEEKITINEVKILISSFLIPEIIFEVMTGYSGAKNNPIKGNRNKIICESLSVSSKCDIINIVKINATHARKYLAKEN